MKKILVVDGNSILNRAYYGVRPLTTKTGLFTQAVYGFATILRHQIESLSPDCTAVAFDVKAPTFRHLAYDGYKATRKGMPPELAQQLPYAKRCAEAMGATVLTLEGWEADDILGALARMTEDTAVGEWQCYLLTGDRDSFQLISDSTSVIYAGKDNTVYDRAKFHDTYGVEPEQFVDVKALMGDTSDNIPGVAGIGEKTALTLIQNHGSLDGVYRDIDAKDIAKGVRAKLTDGKDSAYLSQKLARIDRRAPLDVTLTSLADKKPDNAALAALFRELEFTGLMKRFGLDGEAEKSKPHADVTYVTPESPEAVLDLWQTWTSAIGTAEQSGQTVQTGQTETAASVQSGTVSAALMYEDGVLTFCRTPDTVYRLTVTPERLTALLTSSQGKIGWIVYDAKRLWSLLPDLPEDFTFAADVMLSAYVADTTSGDYTPEHLTQVYLGISGQWNAAVLRMLAEPIGKSVSEQGQERLLNEIELPLTRVLSRMERAGFKVDLDGLAKFSEKLQEQAKALCERIYFYAGEEFNVNSPKQLQEVLFERLKLPASKKTQTGYSTNAEVLEQLVNCHPIVADILEYRQLTKLQGTYGEGLAKAADADGRIHSSFQQAVTATGRLSSAEPNLQNIPVRTDLGRELRRFFVPDSPDRCLIDADYSQIELRLLADISGDETMIEAFRSGVDIHAETAATAFRVRREDVTGEMRKRAKAVNFGIVYGISDFSLAQDIGVSKKKAAEYIEAYLSHYPKVAEYLRNIVEQAKRDGYVSTMFGRRRYIPELKFTKKALQTFGERVAMNSPIQGTAADIIKLAMIRVDSALRSSGLDAKLILQVHDELIVEASAADASAACEILVREMESAVSLKLPLTVSAAIGATWFDCKD